MEYLQFDDVMFMLEQLIGHLPLRDLVNFGACCNTARIPARKGADMLVMSELKGAQLTKTSCPEMPYWAQLKAASRACCLARGQSDCWQDKTTPLPLVVNSEGPVFLEFQLTAAKAPNGTPTIGIVDAKTPDGTPDGWSCDLTRQKTNMSFAVALSPGCGSVHASICKDGPTELADFNSTPNSQPGCYRAVLKWPYLGDEEARWNMPIHAGFLLENGNLTFYRQAKDGCWRSSGIICEGLPEQVVPCMFMSSFVGYTNVRFVRIQKKPPAVNQWVNYHPRCQAGPGTKFGWRRFG